MMASSHKFSTDRTSISSSSGTLAPLLQRISNARSPFNIPSSIAPPPLISAHVPWVPIVVKSRASVEFANEAHYISEDESFRDGDEDSEEDWEGELLSELNPLLYLHGRNHRKGIRQKGFSDGETVGLRTSENAPDWAERARQRALQSLEDRNPSRTSYLKKKFDPSGHDAKKKMKKKKKKAQQNVKTKQNPNLLNAQTSISAKSFEEALRLEDEIFDFFSVKGDSPIVKEDVASDGSFASALNNFAFNGIETIESLPVGDDNDLNNWDTSENSGALAVFSGQVKNGEAVSEREKAFNKNIVVAKTALDVLEIVGRGEERTRLLGLPSLLTPLNVATALHRIGKHMETSGSAKSERLAFARKRQMAELVARAMQVLADCSAQGLSNIAWALSKVGGNILYSSEMDLIADAILSNVSELNSQNIANTLGAYSSMQHAAPKLFACLCDRAVEVLEEFSSQELAQVLWAHAELTQPADPLLDALDNICLLSDKEYSNPFAYARSDHLANLGWSYAVLNQIHRPSFKCIWKMLECSLNQNADGKGDMTCCLSTWHLSQIHQVNLCLQYDDLSQSSILLKDAAAKAWEIQKRQSWSSSQYQKDVKWHLVSLGQNWVAEYNGADYSLDFALPEKKIAIEIDGPSHFIRNTGLPLGHTLMKRRLLSQAGWRVLPISYEVWEELDGEVEQRSFLKNLLTTGT
ncbi:hypothetical protein KP509_06G056200 [Ceratopteris richardii]|uniref:RAP domain-containing protein n=1 Tax=Ceratopteris richardii TaxID=49495 RepID=A0A8T2UPE4_CERRI|nr:hypothetical protein KP509_06G056200 [Ceratopteris richardii]